MSDQILQHPIKICIERDIADKIEMDSFLELLRSAGIGQLLCKLK